MRKLRPLILAVVALSLLALATPSRADSREHYYLIRPILKPGKASRPDYGFPFGWTRWGQSPLHHGDDFVNPLGTPVVAAADGTVYFAGSDQNNVVGEYANFYGNVIIIKHDFSAPEGGTVSTLYGHLNTILVQTGQRVTKGQQIGTVGKTGIAQWYHLHFEVRVGNPQDYNAVRNPALWFAPQPGMGVLIGRMVDQNGNLAMGIRFTMTHHTYTLPGWTYADPNLHSDPAYNENFVLEDIPKGCYQFRVRNNGGGYAFSQPVCIRAGETAVMNVQLGPMY